MTKSIERCQKRTKRIKNVLNNLLLQGISISFLTVTRHSLNPPSPPPFINEMGGSQELGGGVGLIMEWCWLAEGVLTTYFMKTPILTTLIFQILSTPSPLPHFPLTYITHPHCSFYCPVSLAKWQIIYIFFTSTLIWYHTQTPSTLRGQ